MLCRALLAAAALSYLICVLVLSGLQREDLDVKLLLRLQQHDISVDDFNSPTLREECLAKRAPNRNNTNASIVSFEQNEITTRAYSSTQNSNISIKDMLDSDTIKINAIVKLLKGAETGTLGSHKRPSTTPIDRHHPLSDKRYHLTAKEILQRLYLTKESKEQSTEETTTVAPITESLKDSADITESLKESEDIKESLKESEDIKEPLKDSADITESLKDSVDTGETKANLEKLASLWQIMNIEKNAPVTTSAPYILPPSQLKRLLHMQTKQRDEPMLIEKDATTESDEVNNIQRLLEMYMARRNTLKKETNPSRWKRKEDGAGTPQMESILFNLRDKPLKTRHHRSSSPKSKLIEKSAIEVTKIPHIVYTSNVSSEIKAKLNELMTLYARSGPLKARSAVESNIDGKDGPYKTQIKINHSKQHFENEKEDIEAEENKDAGVYRLSLAQFGNGNASDDETPTTKKEDKRLPPQAMEQIANYVKDVLISDIKKELIVTTTTTTEMPTTATPSRTTTTTETTTTTTTTQPTTTTTTTEKTTTTTTEPTTTTTVSTTTTTTTQAPEPIPPNLEVDANNKLSRATEAIERFLKLMDGFHPLTAKPAPLNSLTDFTLAPESQNTPVEISASPETVKPYQFPFNWVYPPVAQMFHFGFLGERLNVDPMGVNPYISQPQAIGLQPLVRYPQNVVKQLPVLPPPPAAEPSAPVPARIIPIASQPIMIQTNPGDIPPIGFPMAIPQSSASVIVANPIIVPTTKIPPRWDFIMKYGRNPEEKAEMEEIKKKMNSYSNINLSSKNSENTRQNSPYVDPNQKPMSSPPEYNSRMPDIQPYVAPVYQAPKTLLDVQDIRGFHEKLENVEDWPRDLTWYKNRGLPATTLLPAILVGSRFQESMSELKKPRFDDTHFNNFFKTQQKVNDMLERILAMHVKPVVRAVETT